MNAAPTSETLRPASGPEFFFRVASLTGVSLVRPPALFPGELPNFYSHLPWRSNLA